MKTKKISTEEYLKTFCKEQRIRDRKAVYVTWEVHEQIQEIYLTLQKQHISISSLVNAILAHHLETHKQVIEEVFEIPFQNQIRKELEEREQRKYEKDFKSDFKKE